jgi:hypothetical protein
VNGSEPEPWLEDGELARAPRTPDAGFDAGFAAGFAAGAVCVAGDVFAVGPLVAAGVVGFAA